MILHPDFFNALKPGAMRASFQFTVSGTKQAGVVYVNRDLPAGMDILAVATEAAKVAAKRAGASDATLHRIAAPTR